MLDPHIYHDRIRLTLSLIRDKRYVGAAPLRAEYLYDADKPIPYDVAQSARYTPIRPGTQWGTRWASAWFRFTGMVPRDFKGREVAALIDIGGEGCVFVNGSPAQGITNKWATNLHTAKRLVPLFAKAKGNEKVDILVEGAANELFGEHGGEAFTLNTCELVCIDRSVWQLYYDCAVLESLIDDLPEHSPRRNRLLRGLNDIANQWAEGSGVKRCLAIAARLLRSRAHDSATTAYGIGHAHLDLGWLWPVRETKRKGGRTFSTALQMIKEYPEYIFGASQPQLYAWVKEEYPALYARVKKAVAAGRWECQGAMWVEPDMNVTGGESLVRQCLYGKAFFQEEFGVDVRNLWLPDVFGYSAALPQILKKCGVDYFMTQKISWNETNTFPHHTFMWEGIDGTRILSHFLPTNDYNNACWPGQMIQAEKRYAQNDVSGEFLNLFGVGDGGGGPGRIHIEFGKRQKDLEGAPKFLFATAERFFQTLDTIPKKDLPTWTGELYLELHRGTYTTQAKMKRYNRALELRLRETEFLCAVAGTCPKASLDRIWKNTLLNQFHDILPGSSIGWVYRDAHRESARNLNELQSIARDALSRLHPPSRTGNTYVVYNPLSWERTALVSVPAGSGNIVVDGNNTPLPAQRSGKQLLCAVTIPSMGYTTLTVGRGEAPAGPALTATESSLENDRVRVKLGADGTIRSLFDKVNKREVLSGPANELLLWEDRPRSWDAWDICHYYHETTPEKAKRVSVRIETRGPVEVAIVQTLTIGLSTIEQRICLTQGSPLVTIANTVHWNETHKMLRVGARVNVRATEASYEIQYGTLKRPTHSNTSWDRARFEVAGHRFADLSQHDYGCALVNDCKYGYRIQGDTLDLTLLRSPTNPDAEADQGTHTFTFGYLPHQGRLEDSTVLKRAHELNAPPIVHRTASPPELSCHSFFSVSGEGVIIEVVKPAERGSATVLRLYESRGGTERVTVRCARPWQSWTETNMLEQPIGKPSGPAGRKTLTFKPFEIRTFLLR